MLNNLWWLPFGKVPEVTPQQLHGWLQDDEGVQLLDARTGLEFQQGTIGQAIHTPLTEMPTSIEQVTLDPARPVVVLCLSGHRSQPGTRWLRARGFNAFSLRGGILAWQKAGFSIEKPA